MGNKQATGQDKSSSSPSPPFSDNKVTQTRQEEEVTVEEDAEKEEAVVERNIEINFIPELGGGKGWPPDANVVLYHHATGLVIAGTESGTLYAFGDGFQFMQPAIVQMDITHIISLYEEKILVCFADNSMAVFLLPNLQLAYRIESTWLNPICGDVTVIHIDETRSRYYAYVGTSEGYVRVLHVVADFREVDFCITSVDSGLTGKMAVSDLQLSSKDEKYLIIGYDSLENSTSDSGAVVLFDLSKKKSYRTYKTSSGITTITCNHSGELLFAGTRQGEVLQLGIDKVAMTTVWNSKSEIVDESELDEVVTIRKMSWMYPQSPGSDGCLFVLLGSFGTDTDNLRSVIVALASTPCGDLKPVLNVPPLHNSAEVVGFRIVSTWDKESSERGAIPGLLLLTQNQSEDRDVVRELMLLRCPSVDVASWELELGILQEPRPAMEVLPGTSPITFTSGCVPGIPLGNFLISIEKKKSAQDPIRASSTNLNMHSIAENESMSISSSKPVGRRVSARDFFEDVNVILTNFAESEGPANTWEMVLASGVRSEIDKMDVVFVGHMDGCIVAWGVSLPPQNAGNHARSNCWIPLTALRCGTAEITSIIVNGKFLVAGDDSGKIVVWDCEDEHRNELNERFRGDVNQSITSLCIDSTGQFLIIGTREGRLYSISDWSGNELRPLGGLDQFSGLMGPVSNIFLAPYWRENGYQQAAYAIFSCGFIVVINISTLEILSHSGQIDSALSEEIDRDKDVIFGFVVNSRYEQVIEISEEMNESVRDIPAILPPVQTSSLSENKSFMKKFKRGSGESISLPPLKIPPLGPRYLFYVQGKHLVQCDIGKFARIIPNSPIPIFSVPNNNVFQCKEIATSDIVTCQLLLYTEDATRFWSKPVLSLSFLDEMADLYFQTIKSGFSLNRIDCLPKVLTEPYNINAASILSNGSTYICSNGNIIYSINPHNPEFLLPSLLPSRADTMCVPPDVSQQLLQKEVVDTSLKKNKRRSSFLSIPTSGIDLDKLFAKSFDPRQKEEFFRQSLTRLSLQEQKEEYTIKSDNVKDNTTSALRTKQILDETRQNFEERGERINILNKRTEEFKTEATKYKVNSAAHKEKMKLKAQRWGVF